MSEFIPKYPDAPIDRFKETNDLYDRIGTVRYALGEENLRAGTFIIYGEKIELYLSEVQEYFEAKRKLQLALARAKVAEAVGNVTNERVYTAHPFPIDVTQDPRDVSLCNWPGSGGKGV